MSSTENYHLANGKGWAVGSFVVGDADVIIPIDQLDGMSNEEIGVYVRALVPKAAEQLAAEIDYNWNGYHSNTPPAYARRILRVLAPHEQSSALIRDICYRLRYIIRHGSYPKQNRRNTVNKQSKQKDNSGYVYLAYADTGHYKIGLSVNPEARIQHFDTKMPISVEIVHTIETDNMRQLEIELHDRYADKRTTGEWFALDDYDVEEIKALGPRTES